MTKKIFSVFSLALFAGCGFFEEQHRDGGSGSYGYCLLGNSCSYMTEYNCNYNYGGSFYASQSGCNSNVYQPSSSSSSSVCGANYYDPSTHFCYDGATYSCNSQPYNPSTHFCLSGTITARCGDKEYTSAQTCQDGVVYGICGGNLYNPETQRCGTGNVIETKCGASYYNPETQRCGTGNVIETKCGANYYNPETQRCDTGNVIETKCGANYYDPSTHFCLNSTIYVKCGVQDYKPSTQYCSNGTAKAYGSVSYGGKTYKTVVIGTQTWMAENLNVAHNSGNGNSVCYDNQESNCDAYGRLYDWAAAMDLPSSCNSSSCASLVSSKHRGLCPEGFHIPTNDDWSTLENNVGGSSTAGRYLKSKEGWKGCGPAGSLYLCEDTYGFSALPGGYGRSDGSFSNAGDDGYWWSNSEGNASYAYRRYMYYYNEVVDRSIDILKSFLHSVRCLQKDSALPSSSSVPSSSSSMPISSSSVCGANYYDPSTHFCYDGATYSCNSQPYNPSTHFCLSGTVTAKCGGKEYSSTQTCQDGVVYGTCGGNLYNTETQRCGTGNVIETKCGANYYDPETQRCGAGNVIETKCGTNYYDPSTQRCGAGNVIETKCGTNYYDPSTHFCLNSTIYAKCGNQDYSPSTQYCSNGTVKAYDGSFNYGGKTYKTVAIGTQTWMAENLNVAHNSGNGNSVCYNNQESYCNTYGRLYNWAAAMNLPSSCNSSACASQVQSQHRGICPEGWHIPSDDEWTTLLNNVGGSSTAGRKLKATSGWGSCDPSGFSYVCEDAYGFAALPGGCGDSDGNFTNAGFHGGWWDSMEGNASIAYYWSMDYYRQNVLRGNVNNDKAGLFSVRCVQDYAL
jgi:uncharacterized protein (TIGR02145 family)